MKRTPAILLVQDREMTFLPFLQELANRGLNPRTSSASTMQDFQQALKKQAWDCIIACFPIDALAITQVLDELKSLDIGTPLILLAKSPQQVTEYALPIISSRCQVAETIPQVVDLVETLLCSPDKLASPTSVGQDFSFMSETLVQYALNVADVMIMILDDSFKIVTVNKKGADILGRPLSAIQGQPWLENFVPEGNREIVRTVFQRLLEKGPHAVPYFEYPVLTPEGEEKMMGWHNPDVHLRQSDSQKLLLFCGEDITEEKMLEQSREAFIATLTHDLNTPIRAESQVLELLLDESFGPLTAQQREVIEEIQRSNRFMKQMVEALLSIYKYEDRKVQLNLVQTNLKDLVEKTVNETIYPLALEKQQTLELNLEDADVPVYLDPPEIQRVIVNLLRNAVMFSPEKSSIAIEASAKDNDMTISIKDKGPGIEPEMMKHLFKRYSSVSKRFRHVGTGLSLYLSRQIIEAHGGRIGAESKLGQGSRFYFTLPITPLNHKPVQYSSNHSV